MKDVVIVGRRFWYNNAFRRTTSRSSRAACSASKVNSSRGSIILIRHVANMGPGRCRWEGRREGVIVRHCILFIKVNARVRRVPKAVHVIVLVYYHDHANTEHRSHREWPVVACDNCFSGVLWRAMVVVCAGGMLLWWWCMAGVLPATHTPF